MSNIGRKNKFDSNNQWINKKQYKILLRIHQAKLIMISRNNL